MQQRITAIDVTNINKTLFELNCLRRWSELMVAAGGKYSELAKQAMNSFIAYFWSAEAIYEGHEIDFTVYPKIAILRSFTKSIQCDIPECNLRRIFEIGQVSRNDFDQMIHYEFSKRSSNEFLEHIKYLKNSIEASIYKASTKLATILELEEIKTSISSKDYNQKKKQLYSELKEFSNLSGFKHMISDQYMEIFSEYSKLRNRIRWAKHPNILKCNVLGHHFDVAVFAYIMALEKNPNAEELAAKYFFMGIFHDFPERWTGDMPSPIKDSVYGLREATEKFENEVMENNVYAYLPNYQVKSIKDIMLEDEGNADLKAFLKVSDNFSAFIECWRELDSGSRHYYYIDVVEETYSRKEKLPENFRLLTEELYGNLFYK